MLLFSVKVRESRKQTRLRYSEHLITARSEKSRSETTTKGSMGAPEVLLAFRAVRSGKEIRDCRSIAIFVLYY